jgi:hypothetical protein
MQQELSPDFVSGMESDALSTAPSEEEAATLADMVGRAHSLTMQISDLELTTKAAKKELEDLMVRRIPGEMDKVGMAELGMVVNENRVRIALDFMAYGSLAKAPDFEDAVDYLEANGFEGGILTTVSAQFRREQKADAETLAERIRETGSDVAVVEDVHASTLRAFVRDRFAADPNFDAARVGITIVRQAKFTVR